MNKEYLWVERYRPKQLGDCILPERTKNLLREYMDTNTIPNLLLTGTPGCGKGSLVNAIIHETGADSIFINCSVTGVDAVRTTIKNFASSVSMIDGDRKKVVVLDEIDGATGSNNLQTALRSYMETFSSNALFILTGNNSSKIIPALHSRCVTIDYNKEINRKETPALMKALMKRLEYILDEEKITYDRKVVAALIKRDFPDFRKVLNTMQSYSSSGEIDSGILISTTTDVTELIGLMKNKDFDAVRAFVDEVTDTSGIYSELYKQFGESLTKNQYAAVICCLADYDYKDAFVSNPQLNLMACLVEVMVDL